MMFNKYLYDLRYFPSFSSQFQQLHNSSYIIHNNLCSPIFLNPRQQLYTCGTSQIYSYPNFYQNMVQQQILIEQQKQLIESQIQLQRQLHKLHSATLNEKQTSFSISQIQHDNNATYVVKTSTNNISYEDNIIQYNMIKPNINIDTEYRDESEIEVIIRNNDQYVQLEVLDDEDLNDEQISFEPVRSEIIEIILDDNISINCNELANMKDKKAEEYTKEEIIENTQSVGITVSKVELIEEIIEPISNLYELVNKQQGKFEQNEDDSNNEYNYNNDIEINDNNNNNNYNHNNSNNNKNNHSIIYEINEIKNNNRNDGNNKIEENESKLLENKTCESNNESNNLLYTTSKLINKSNCENISLDSINQINLLNNKNNKLSNLNLEDNTCININSLNPQDLDTLTPIENCIKVIKDKDNTKENNLILEMESNNESNIESDWENIWESYYSSKSPDINDETDSLCYSLLTTSRTDIEQDNLNQNELIDSERHLYKITNKSEKEILFKLSQCRVISSKIMRNSSMNSPIENKIDEINNEVIDFKDISNKLYNKSNNNIFLDEMDLGFRSLINNGLKLDISEMAKPRIIKK
ncbi:hypothetical protein cand_038200 [Cryptosporidium andersoni]|uniref:Uncharacterized protein n=1 Tax=Cryptosporidium andersoni TaxID=117008 RepID=A0A1J4MUH0_9CRYT|nr:hypothetical protein cand_038200 [Cryptosporidium andersoni]